MKFKNRQIIFSVILLTILGGNTTVNAFQIGPASYFNPNNDIVMNYDFSSGTYNWRIEYGAMMSDSFGNPSKSLRAYGPSLAVFFQQLPAASVTSLKGEEAIFSIDFLSADDSARIAVKYYDQSGWHTQYGNWARKSASTTDPWVKLQTSVTFPSHVSTIQFKVQIMPDYQTNYVDAYFDNAQIMLVDTLSAVHTWGNVALNARLMNSRETYPNSGLTISQLIIGASAVAQSGYYVEAVTLSVDMNPHQFDIGCLGEKTTQTGSVNINSISESNKLGDGSSKSTNTAKNPGVSPIEASVVSSALGAGIGIITIPLTGGLSAAVGILGGSAINVLVPIIAQYADGQDTSATNGCNFRTNIGWDYGVYGAGTEQTARNQAALYSSVGNEVQWTFEEGHSDYKIRIYLRITWAIVHQSSDNTWMTAMVGSTADYIDISVSV